MFLMPMALLAALMWPRDLLGSIGALCTGIGAVVTLLIVLPSPYHFNCPRCSKRFYGFTSGGSMTRGPKPACHNCGLLAGTPKSALKTEPEVGGG
jgi:hypothetical protein